MNYLLYNYYIDFKQKDKVRLLILSLLHELRIVSNRQLDELLNVDFTIPKRTIEFNLTYLRKHNLIETSRKGINSYHYLTKEGHNYIGGFYTYPKVPEYNLQHHLQINDFIIKMLKLCNNHPHLKAVVSERRKVYEVKDMNPQKKGVKFFVPDFIFIFLDRLGREVSWQFEIELTLKTKRRYRDKIFPKYINQLRDYEDAHLFYVTPSPVIKQDLDLYKKYFISKNGNSEEVFERLHVFSAEEFEEQMQRLLKEDPFINW